MKRLVMLVAVLAVVSLSLFTAVASAQDKPAPAQAPEVSAAVKLQLENAALKQQLALVTAQLQICQSKIAPEAYRDVSATIQADVMKIVQDFEKAHPGWTLDAATMTPKKKGSD
jgi:hypothetical protein